MCLEVPEGLCLAMNLPTLPEKPSASLDVEEATPFRTVVVSVTLLGIVPQECQTEVS